MEPRHSLIVHRMSDNEPVLEEDVFLEECRLLHALSCGGRVD